MAVKKKTLEQIAKENNIDISKENAQKVADAYIQPKLDEIAASKQQVAASAQSALKSLENDYFNQYRASMYNAQSRGLTGGLANIDATRLRTQLGEANSEISNALIQKQSELDLERGTALSNAKAYKTDYLNKMLETVIKLREDDYAQRLAEYQFNQQMAMERAQLAQAAAASKQAAEAAELDNEYKRMQILNEKLPEIMRTFQSYINKNDIGGAYQYAAKQGLDQYGYSVQDLARDALAISTYNNYNTQIDEYTKAVNAARAKVGAGYVGGVTGTAAGLFLTPAAGIGIAGVSGAGVEQAKQELKKYQDLLAQAKTNFQNAQLPNWYANYYGINR